MSRRLNEIFMEDLNSGKLSRLLNIIKIDATLQLEIRSNYVNIYYRGGNLCRIDQKKDRYTFLFDTKYVVDNNNLWQSVDLDCIDSEDKLVEMIPFIKREMDHWFSKYPKNEREAQQQIVLENNYTSISGDTDYFVCDVEYARSDIGCRFDVMAIKWPSTSSSRNRLDDCGLAFLEVKYGDGALTGNAGLKKHFQDIIKFVEEGQYQSFISEMESVYSQKIKLGLFPGQSKTIKISKSIKPQFIILVANHKPAKSVLQRELRVILDEYPHLNDQLDILIAQSSLMGYGLYEEKLLSLQDYVSYY